MSPGRHSKPVLAATACALVLAALLPSGCALSSFGSAASTLPGSPSPGLPTTSSAGATRSPQSSAAADAVGTVTVGDATSSGVPSQPAAATGTLPPAPVEPALTAPSAAAAARARLVPVPVLMYHAIGDPPQGTRNPDLYVPRDQFNAEVDYLSSHGYHVVSLQQVFDFWQGRTKLPKRPVVISFDDGFASDYTFVAPLFRQKQWPGVLNLIVGRKKPRMSVRLVRGLIHDGWEIDSHTISHEDLRTLTDPQLAREVAGSRVALQDQYHVPVNFFCYPSGRYDARVIAAVKAAGYEGATSTHYGFARSETPYTLKRVRISGGQSLASFAVAVRSK